MRDIYNAEDIDKAQVAIKAFEIDQGVATTARTRGCRAGVSFQVPPTGHGGFGGFGHGGFGHSRPLAAQSFAALSTRSQRLNGVVP